MDERGTSISTVGQPNFTLQYLWDVASDLPVGRGRRRKFSRKSAKTRHLRIIADILFKILPQMIEEDCSFVKSKILSTPCRLEEDVKSATQGYRMSLRISTPQNDAPKTR